MALRTAEQYKESLRRLRPNIWKFGESIRDVTTHPATRQTVEGHAQIYAAARSADNAGLLVTDSHLTGRSINRYLSIMRSADDLIANCRIKRLMFNLTGTCTGARCGGWSAINSLWATTHDMDKELGTSYHGRLREWLNYAQEEDICISGALTDPKGDRSLRASQQADPDMNLHVTEVRENGIVVRGAKIMIAGVAAANEIFVLPGTGYGEPDKDFALSFVVPRDIEGLTIVEARHPSDLREWEEGFDTPVKTGGITQAYLFFEDVFVPRERVFMCREHKFSGQAVMDFIVPYRSAIGGCVAGQGDLMAGAAALMARANGLSTRAFADKLTQMYINNQTTFALGVAAAVLGRQHPSGAWLADPLTANVNKVMVATLPYQTKLLAQEISGGIAETGCMPSYKDFNDARYGGLVRKYLKAAAPAESRARLARMVEWLTVGAGIPGCMHGGGSPEGAKLIVRASTDLERLTSLVKRLIEIKEDIPEPGKK